MTVQSDPNALFVYGSLLEEGLAILGHPVDVIPARLEGFERRTGRYFYIVPVTGAETGGMVMLDLTVEDWGRLDAYEEVPDLYTREEVEVDTYGERLRCWAYLPTAKCISLPAN